MRWLIPFLMLPGVAWGQQLVSPIEVKDCGTGYVKSIAATGLVGCAAAAAGGVSTVAAGDGSLTVSPTTGAVVAALNVGNPNSWSGQQSFAATVGTVRTVTGTTLTLASTDCGKLIRTTSGSAVTVTLPNSLAEGCNIALAQRGTGQINLSCAAGGCLTNAHAYTRSYGQGAVIGVSVDSNSGGSSAAYLFVGDGAP